MTSAAELAGVGAAGPSSLADPFNADLYGPLGPDGFPIRTLKRKTYYRENFSMELPARYTMNEVVGRGAYGVVISALDTETMEVVAIKKIGNMFADVVDGKRILREMKLLHFFNSPKHPNVLSLRDVFRSRKNTIVCNSLAAQFADPSRPPSLPPVNTSDFFADVYLVTDFITHDLNRVIKSNQLTEDHACFFAYQMCSGLRFIHAGGVIHRDIKPSNMLVTKSCELKIADFGLARIEGSSNLTNYVVTRWYRPPEILLANEEYDGKVDMWGIGCLIVEIMTGNPLFPGNDYINQLVLITDEIGTPEDEDLDHITSDEAVSYLKTLPKNKAGFDVKAQLRRHLPQEVAAGLTVEKGNATISTGGISELMVDFVSKLLVFNPAKRLSALEAMHHPWVAQYHSAESEANVPAGRFTWEHEDQDLTLDELKELTREAVDTATLENWRFDS